MGRSRGSLIGGKSNGPYIYISVLDPGIHQILQDKPLQGLLATTATG